MAGIVKRIVAVLVSIVWLSLILGLLAGFLVPDLHELLPTPVKELTDPVALRERWESFTDSLTPGIGFQPPAEPDATATPTPDPALSTQPTATPVPETPTTAPPTAEPATPTTAPAGSSGDGDTPPAAETPVSVSVSEDGQADLRSAPGEDADVIGLVAAGGRVNLSGRDATGNWYRLDDGPWIHADDLVDPPLDQVPIVTAETQPSPEGSEEAAPPADATDTGPQLQPAAVAALVNADSNLRAGPGVEYDRVGGINFGEEASIVGISEDGEWYLLESGAWIFAALVTEAVDVPVVTEDAMADQMTATEPEPVEDGQTGTEEELTTTGAEQAEAERTDAEQAETEQPEEELTESEQTESELTESELTEADDEQAQPVVIAPLGANLRAGPGVEFERVDGVEQGQILTIVAQDETGEWLKLEDASWIFADLVDNTPTELPVESAEIVETEIDDAEDGEAISGETTAPPEDAEREESNQVVIATINTDANLRNGPGLEATIVDSAPAGAQVTIIDRSDDEQWLQVENGFWILAALVDILPADGVENTDGESGTEDNDNNASNEDDGEAQVERPPALPALRSSL